MKNCYTKRVQPNFHYFRDSNGNEVDLLAEQSNFTYAVEIKSAKTINDSFFKGMNYFSALNSGKVKSICVYGGEDQYNYKGHAMMGWKNLDHITLK